MYFHAYFLCSYTKNIDIIKHINTIFIEKVIMNKTILHTLIFYSIFLINVIVASENYTPINQFSFHRPLTVEEITEIQSIIQGRNRFIHDIAILEQYFPLLSEYGKEKLERNKKFVNICNEAIILVNAIGIDAYNQSHRSGQLFLEAVYLYREISYSETSEIRSERSSTTMDYTPTQSPEYNTPLENLSDEDVHNILSDLMNIES